MHFKEKSMSQILGDFIASQACQWPAQNIRNANSLEINNDGPCN
jgi:hypothetical protein